MIFSSFLELVGIGFIFVFFNALINDDISSFQSRLSFFKIITSENKNSFLINITLIMIFVFLLRNVLLFSSVYLFSIFRVKLQTRYTINIFQNYLNQSYSWHLTRGYSNLIVNISQHVGMVVQHIIIEGFEALSSLVMVFFILIMIIYVKPFESLLAFVSLLTLALIYFSIFSKKHAKWGKLHVKYFELFYNNLKDAIQGIKLVRIFDLREFFKKKLISNVSNFMMITHKQNIIKQFPKYLFELIIIISLLLFIYSNLLLEKDLLVVVPTLIFLATAFIRFLPHIGKILSYFQSLKTFRPAVLKLWETLEKNDNFRSNDSNNKVEKFKSMDLKNVYYKYPNQTEYTVSDISFSIKPGEKIAIVGISGSGKTTIINVLLGLLTPTKGKVLLNGKILKKNIKNFFSFVPQESFMIDENLKKNILLSDVDIPEKKLKTLIDNLSLTDFFESLPEGFNSKISDHDRILSGGEMQRLGIARSLVRNCKLLILDEPTSNLDTITENDVLKTLSSIPKNVSIVVIAHRISTIRNFDKIIFVNNGKIEGVGNFEALQKASRKFKEMVSYFDLREKFNG